MALVTTLSVVVASPGDVMAERDALQEVVNEFNHGIARAKELRIELIRWETDSYPGFHSDGPQGLIDPILNIDDCDVFIGIFWKRFGSPVKHADSGTEHEFHQAYSAWQKTGSPRIMFYFNQKPYMPGSSSEAEQARRVMDFKENFPQEGLWCSYNGESEFERLVRKHLTKFIIDYSNSETIEDEDSFDTDDSNETEPKVLHDEQIIINGKSHEPYDFTLDVGNKLFVDIKSTEPLNIVIIDTKDTDAWLNNKEVNTYKICENRKRTRFDFEVEEYGDYSLILTNESFLTSAEVDIEVSYLE